VNIRDEYQRRISCLTILGVAARTNGSENFFVDMVSEKIIVLDTALKGKSWDRRGLVAGFDAGCSHSEKNCKDCEKDSLSLN